MIVEIAGGWQAWNLLEREDFQKSWKALHAGCPWATPFQSVEFVRTWYGAYRDQFTPVLARASWDGELVGLLTLAAPADSRQLVVAGTHHAEYQVWLARPEWSDAFVEAVLGELRKQFPKGRLTFTYLPPATPLEWIRRARAAGLYVELRPLLRPLMAVSDTGQVAAAWRKKSNKSKLHRLMRAGEVHFEQLLDPAELDGVFDQIIVCCDFRQGGVNNSLPFHSDPAKRQFHLALMQTPDLLHVTILRVNNTVVAAHLGVRDKDRVSLGVFAHSPFHAPQSPGKLHLLMLGQMLNKQGFSVFDLTPALDSWKGRFATHCDQVHTLAIFFGYLGLMRHRMKRRAISLAKWGAQGLGVQPAGLREVWEKLSRLRISEAPGRLLARLRRKLWQTVELRIYAFPADQARKPEGPALMSKDRLEDLLLYQPPESWQTRQRFLTEALMRIQKGNHVYTRAENGRLLHYGWMAEREESSSLPEVGLSVKLPPGSATLYDFFTDPRERGRGLYQAALRQMSYEAAQIPGTRQIYISVRADNSPSRHVIEKIGFTCQYSLFQRTRLGKTTRWASAAEPPSQQPQKRRATSGRRLTLWPAGKPSSDPSQPAFQFDARRVGVVDDSG